LDAKTIVISEAQYRTTQILVWYFHRKKNSVKPSPETTASSTLAANDVEANASANLPLTGAVASDTRRKPRWDPEKNHGRYSAKDYTGCEQVTLKHTELKAGDACPDCAASQTPAKLYPADPGVLIRLKGQPLIVGTCYHIEKLRCAVCSAVYAAPIPKEVAEQSKYDVSCRTNIAMSRYYMGLPFKRLELWQSLQRIPLADATQWDQMRMMYPPIKAIRHCLEELAAQGQVVFYDDTPNKILAQSALVKEGKALRKGVYTTAVVSQIEQQAVYLFYTSERYAGENIEALLQKRAEDSAILITMSDASANNLPRKVPDDLLARWILCFCLVHGRRKFYEIVNFFESECDYVLQQIGEVYHYEKICREKGFNAQRRLEYHQIHSGPIMEGLRIWLNNQLLYGLIEPNSGFGEAATYLLRHFEALTQFLRYAGAPLDNSICEQAIKIIIRHRKNSLFYKSPFGAEVGDALTSVIHTAARNGVNVVDYLNTLQCYAGDVIASPEEWLPWTYQATVKSRTWREAA
jgi:transposase